MGNSTTDLGFSHLALVLSSTEQRLAECLISKSFTVTRILAIYDHIYAFQLPCKQRGCYLIEETMINLHLLPCTSKDQWFIARKLNWRSACG